MQNHWTDDLPWDPDDLTRLRERNPDSSVAAQYEDSVPPDPDQDFEPS